MSSGVQQQLIALPRREEGEERICLTWLRVKKQKLPLVAMVTGQQGVEV